MLFLANLAKAQRMIDIFSDFGSGRIAFRQLKQTAIHKADGNF
jgi:hypothetical protein